ncbi:S41 family peptidase [Paludisphaera mucosa]|uniref:S41 family peptidase n=1 Tax=Paludisphaera mucosa TaxID=3030827 RepID=A0ABT6FCG8_9BACT|nr:S41 family peptidase [Paludisphaera mucosa]MDG3005283.1 S41 family peptidase [Paludisphaera mucosa]
MSRRRRIFLALAAAAVLSPLCWLASGTRAAKPKDEMLELYGLFVDAVEKVEANYVRPVNRKELLESALEGMLQNLDQHSSYINMGEWQQFRKQIEGKFGGIGIQVGIDHDTGRLRVIAPMVNTPAYEAGILAGDLILEIDGHSTEGMSSDKAVETLTGRPGTEVELNVLHEGSEQPTPIKLSRAVIEVPSVLGERREKDGSWDFMLDKDKKIGYIRITNFMQSTGDEVRKALDKLKDEGARAVVLDLRDDPGGLLSAAVEVSDLFLDKGDIVSTKGRNTIPKSYVAQQDSPYESLPMAVLVNGNSASASEIVSAALQDHKRAVVVGSRSYGKGSVQNILELEDGNSVLKLTVASYHRPSGENIHRFRDAKASDKWGVTPDPGMEVKLTPAEYRDWFLARRGRDLPALAKLNAAKKPVEAKSDAEKAQDNKEKVETKDVPKDEKPPADPTKPEPPKAATPPEGAPPFVDKVLDKALEVLKGKLDAPAPAEEKKAA